MDVIPRVLKDYRTLSGIIPFRIWFDSLRDVRLKKIIDRRLFQMANGLFGDCKWVGKGVYELRIHFGAGCRIYFGERGSNLIILLLGGEKHSQSKDILKAHAYWEDYLRRYYS